MFDLELIKSRLVNLTELNVDEFIRPNLAQYMDRECQVALHCGIESKVQSGIGLKTKYGR